jgi:hypothetical protein
MNGTISWRLLESILGGLAGPLALDYQTPDDVYYGRGDFRLAA